MSIRQKSLLVSTTALLVLLALLYTVAEAILIESYTRLEAESVGRNIERAANSIASRLTHLSSSTADWAHWDDTYTFIKGEYEDFIADNLIIDTMMNLRLNVMILVDASGEIIYTKGLDLTTGAEFTFPDTLYAQIAEQRHMLNRDDLKDQVAGLFGNAGEVMMIGMSHIINSQREGPIEGTLIFGQCLNTDYIDTLSSTLELTLAVHPFDDAQLSDDLRAAKAALLTGKPNFSQPLAGEIVAGYKLLQDLDGNPIRILKSNQPRDIYSQGQITIWYFMVAMIAIGLALIVTVVLLIDRIILARLTELSNAVTHIRNTGDISLRVRMNHRDEITALAEGFNGMLSALEQTRGALQETHDHLEQQVIVRTRDLEQTNAQLQKEIAERKCIQYELLQTRDQALQALQLKTQILANISHDSRTPLSVIALRMELMQRGRYGPVTDQQRKVLDSVLVNVHQLVLFIDNLLSGSQIEAKRIELHPAAIQPAALFESLAKTMQPLAEHKGLMLSWMVEADVPPTLSVDALRFKQILQNLVNNAIKFTDHGSVDVRICLPDDRHWALVVADTGIGIPHEMQGRIFEAFWQIDGSLTRTANRGIGLGLSVTRELATLMNGEISLQSVPHGGSVFTVRFPLEDGQGVPLNDRIQHIAY